jgi:hypothetical protein
MNAVRVADDLHELADSTAALFELLGYQTRTAYHGREAVDGKRRPTRCRTARKVNAGLHSSLTKA